MSSRVMTLQVRFPMISGRIIRFAVTCIVDTDCLGVQKSSTRCIGSKARRMAAEDTGIQMKVVRFNQPGPSSVLAVETIPVPKPESGQVLVRVHAAGLNKIEGMIRAGFIPTKPPVILGMDGAGVVEQVGSGKTQFKSGDRVLIFARHFSSNGTYAQYFMAQPDQLIRLPQNYTFQDGAALGTPFMAAYRAVAILGHAKSGEVLLINGASGGVGLCAMDIGKTLGCKVIGVAGHLEGLNLIKKRGATAISYKDADFIQKVQEAAGPAGVNMILETNAKNLPNDVLILAKCGRLVLIGSPGKELVDFGIVLGKELTIKGMVTTDATPEQYTQMFAALEKALKDNSVHPVIEKVYKMEDVVMAHDFLMEQRGTAGKLILDTS